MQKIDLTSEIHGTSPELELLLEGQAVVASPFIAELLEELGIAWAEEDGRIHLNEKIDVLQPLSIRSVTSLGGQQNPPQPYQLAVHRVITSTNDELMLRLKTGTGQFLACVAETQTAGKGRRGRRWVSPFGRNIFLSVGWRIPLPASQLGGLSIVIGMCVAGVLKRNGVEGVRLKWPNDLILGGGKLGGILVELQSPSGTLAKGVGVVVGVGINLTLKPSEVGEINQPWSQVDGDLNISRNLLIGSLINEIMQGLVDFSVHGFSHWRENWPDFNINQGAFVEIIANDRVITGIDRGVDELGNLQLERNGQIELFSSGEVSLRALT